MTLARRAASGVTWTGASTTINLILQFTQLTVLARLLSPRDFGLMAMLLVVTGFAQTYADMGISQAIIHRQDTTRVQLSSLYWLNILAGACVFLVVVALAPLVAAFYHEPRLQGLTMLSALVFLIIPFGQQFEILLQKELRFKPLCIIETVSTACGVGVAIGSALAGFNVLALIFGQLANNGCKAFALAALGWSRWRPGLRFRRDDMHGYLGFGLYQMGTNSINFFNSRVDQLLLGGLIGAHALGLYSLAWNLAIQPVTRINPILTRVAFPVFARVQDDLPRLTRGYLVVVRLLSVVNFPLLIGLAATAPLLIPVAFGAQWQQSVPLLQLLAFVSLLRTIANPAGALLLSKGRADMSFRFNAFKLFVQVPGIYLGAHLGGVLGVALALVGLQGLYACASYRFLIRRMLGPCLRRYLGSIVPALATALVMGAVVWVFPFLVGAPGALRLAAQIALGAAVYLGLTAALQKRQLLELKRQLFPPRARHGTSAP